MKRNDAAENATRKLYGPTVQYADGKLVPGQVVDVERVLTKYQYLGPDERSAFLCIIAHDLTVAVRSIVFDPPVTEIGLDRVKSINELSAPADQLSTPVASDGPHKTRPR